MEILKLAPVLHLSSLQAPIGERVLEECIEDCQEAATEWAIEAPMLGLDPDRDGQAVYRGPDPFYLRDRSGWVTGPISHADLIARCAAQPSQAKDREVSVDGRSFISLFHYAVITGQEHLVQGVQARPSETTESGSLNQRGLTAILSQLERRRATGRLILSSIDWLDTVQRREIHLVDGQITFVYSEDPALALPALMIERQILTAEALPAVMREAVQSRSSVDRVVATRAGIDCQQTWTMMMKRRLAEVYSWPSGHYAFDERIAPLKRAPVSTSMVSLAAEMVTRTSDERFLLERLRDRLDAPLLPSRRLREGAPGMKLGRSQLAWVGELLNGKPLRRIMVRQPREVRAILALADVLFEAGLLAVPSATKRAAVGSAG